MVGCGVSHFGNQRLPFPIIRIYNTLRDLVYNKINKGIHIILHPRKPYASVHIRLEYVGPILIFAGVNWKIRNFAEFPTADVQQVILY